MQIGFVQVQGNAIWAHQYIEHQRFINDVLNYLSNFFNIYLYYILVFSKSFDKYLTHDKAVLHRLHNNQQQSKHSKCEFLHSLLWILGHIVSTKGLSPELENIVAISKLIAPN